MRSSFVCVFLACICVPAATALCADPPSDHLAVSFEKDGNLTTDELAALMGGFIWKIDVTLPKGAKEISIAAQSGNAGDKCAALTGSPGIILKGAEERATVLVAITPLNGSITDAAKLHISLVLRVTDNDGAGTTSTATDVDNPLKNSASYSTATPPPEIRPGIFNLVEGHKNGEPITGDAASISSAAVRLQIKVD